MSASIFAKPVKLDGPRRYRAGKDGKWKVQDMHTCRDDGELGGEQKNNVDEDDHDAMMR